MRRVTTVVNYDVNPRYLIEEIAPETPVGLVPDEDAYTLALVGPARRLDIYTVKSAAVTEVVLPHLEAPAAEDADVEDVDLVPDELPQMSVVDVEVMAPLPQPGTIRVPVEVLLECIGSDRGSGGLPVVDRRAEASGEGKPLRERS
jgi:hypothetical protein